MFPGPQCLAQIPWGAVSRLRRSEFIHINPRLAPWATVRSRLTALGLFTLVRDIMCYTNSGTALAGRVSAATRCKSSHWFSVLMSSGVCKGIADTGKFKHHKGNGFFTRVGYNPAF